MTRLVRSGFAKRSAWELTTRNLLRAELVRRGWSFADLAEALSALGVVDHDLNLRNNVRSGKFSAVFLFQCCMALGIDWLRVPKIDEVNGLKVCAGQESGKGT